jgi:hypothetical protein
MDGDDALIEHLCMPAEWTHSMPFMMIPEDEIGMDKEPEPELLDLMSISEITYQGPYRYYFPRKYKPSDPRGHLLLTDDLRGAGLSQGVKFARQGGGPSTGVYPMLCKCAMYYRPNAALKGVTKTEVVAGFTYKTGVKGQSLVNQRKNCRVRRASGEPQLKKCRTNRPQKGFGLTCKAKLTFYADRKHDRFCIKAYNGNRYHSNHHQLKASEIPTGIKDLSDETVKLVQSMHSAELNRSSIRNLVHQQSGVALKGDQIAYLKRMMLDPNTSKASGVSKKVNELIKVLGEEAGVKFCLLFHDAPEHITKMGEQTVRGTICCETYDGADQNEDGTYGLQSTAAAIDRVDGAHEAAELIRIAHKIGSKGRLLLAIAWVTSEGVSNFAKFPETLGADTTFGTNEERRPFIQVVGKDSLGHSFPAFQGFLPHEKRFIFDWLFQEAIPNLLGRENCAKTRLILTDGDQTEIGAVDTACQSASDMEDRSIQVKLHEAIASAIKTNGQAVTNELSPFWNARHRTCYYHLVIQKLPSVGPKGVHKSTEVKGCWRAIHKWLNTLSNTLETWQEFQLSRRLLESWVTSKRVMGHLGSAVVHSFLEFLARSVFPHEKKFAAYIYQEVPTFDERTTSPNEGENAVIKAKGTGVKNNSSLADSTRNILHNSKVRAKNKHIDAILEWTSSPTWSKSAWSQKLTGKAEGLLLQRLKSSSEYNHVRATSFVWYVRARQSCYPPLDSHGPVPRFIRTRTVEIIDHRGKQFIICDCHRYDRTKIACGHVIHVLESLGVDLASCHLAGVRWTTNYLIKYGSLDISETLRDAFERSLQHPGVPFHHTTNVKDWTGPPTFSCAGLTMNDFRPRSLGLQPIIYNYPWCTTGYLHHKQSTVLGANVSQVLVTTQLFTSPVIGKSDPCLPLVTPECPIIQSQEVRPPPNSPFQDDDSGAKKRPAYFHIKDELTDISRLTEGHGPAEDFVRWGLHFMKGVVSGSHSCPARSAQMEEFSRQAEAMFSKGQPPPSHEENLSQFTRVLLPTDQELHSFNASVETKPQYIRKRRFNEKK